MAGLAERGGGGSGPSQQQRESRSDAVHAASDSLSGGIDGCESGNSVYSQSGEPEQDRWREMLGVWGSGLGVGRRVER
ncbi:hypothetical protein SKAU_G00316660 [Synaphobranchus kaupii]|uniref:Uncharacterized protein n=1 Tax=Synaphobranchus kaupii TaxID=118154 RepID=A0A9Q1ILT0_SYNKA|nr:hypothetical protein SKAU_G00316660 [Synaphobranchus kaupii]